MASVRAKFKVTEITRITKTIYTDERDEQGHTVYKKVEGRTVKLAPVYSTDPGHENKAFWDATPNGSISLDVVNPAGWAPFELEHEYYVDFTDAPTPE